MERYLIQALKAHYPVEYWLMMDNINALYRGMAKDIRFVAKSGQPMDKRLDVSAYFLALIKTLEAQGETYGTIRNVCLEIAAEMVKPKNKLVVFFKRLPAQFFPTLLGKLMIRFAKRKYSRKPNPDGFVLDIITDRHETYGLGYGVDILECGICKLFHKHQSSRYAPILCEIDFLTTELAGLQLVRRGTIAGGAHKCDFRFQRTEA